MNDTTTTTDVLSEMDGTKLIPCRCRESYGWIKNPCWRNSEDWNCRVHGGFWRTVRATCGEPSAIGEYLRRKHSPPTGQECECGPKDTCARCKDWKTHLEHSLAIAPTDGAQAYDQYRRVHVGDSLGMES